MTTTIEPPQAPPVPPVPGSSGPTPPPAPRASSRVVAIVVACVGVLVVLGAAGSAVFGAVAAGVVHESARTVGATGIEDLELDVSASSLEIEFADVDEAELSVRSAFGADRWTLERDGDALRVASPQGWFGGWFGGGWWPFAGSGDAVLTLPREVEGLSADLTLSAGDFTATGTFDELALELNAGRADIQGQATQVRAEVNAGRADLALAQVQEASLAVSAGELNTTFTGRQPGSVSIDVSAGSLTAVVPDGDYALTSDVSAGGFDSDIRSTPGAAHSIDVQVSAGQAKLRTQG